MWGGMFQSNLFHYLYGWKSHVSFCVNFVNVAKVVGI
jgi:hypothetical protein